MLSDTKAYFKSLILRLRTAMTREECQAELCRITEDMKADVSVNIDRIIQQVIQMRPEEGSANYEKNSRLYDSILDQIIKMMEDLEETFTGIFTQFNANIDELWLAISNDKEDQLHDAQEQFRIILDRYKRQWADALQRANQTISNFEKDQAK
jgi:hypothetical protein